MKMWRRNLHKRERGREGERGRKNVVKRAEKRAENSSAAIANIQQTNGNLTEIYPKRNCKQKK